MAYVLGIVDKDLVQVATGQFPPIDSGATEAVGLGGFCGFVRLQSTAGSDNLYGPPPSASTKVYGDWQKLLVDGIAIRAASGDPKHAATLVPGMRADEDGLTADVKASA